ncbi:MAG: 3-keto-disaccharide hydrolase [Phenylobacterium sp.]
MILSGKASKGAVLAAVLLAAGSLAHGAQADGRWRPIFNGHSLYGWTPKIAGHPLGDNYRDTFIVKDGSIRVSYAGYDRFNGQFGHLIYRTPLKAYRLRLSYRMLDPGMPDAPKWARSNSGVMFYGQAPETMTLNQQFPVSVEFQILGKDGEGARPSGSVCTPGTNITIDGAEAKAHCTTSTGPTIPNGTWTRLELEVRPDGEVVQRINGVDVMRYDQVELDPRDADARPLIAARGGVLALTEGYVSLQSEGHPIEFKDIEVQDIAR